MAVQIDQLPPPLNLPHANQQVVIAPAILASGKTTFAPIDIPLGAVLVEIFADQTNLLASGAKITTHLDFSFDGGLTYPNSSEQSYSGPMPLMNGQLFSRTGGGVGTKGGDVFAAMKVKGHVLIEGNGFATTASIGWN